MMNSLCNKKFNKTKKFKKYRADTTRVSWWDYGSNAAYFITMCTKNRKHYFGEVVNGQMELSDLGRAAEVCWKAIPEHFPFVGLGAFVVMPDHMHGIIIINKSENIVYNNIVERSTALLNPITYPKKHQSVNENSQNRFGPQSQNLASVIRGFKIGVTKESKIICPEFVWQSLYHDRIIRNEFEYNRIEHYIIANPKNWGKSKS